MKHGHPIFNEQEQKDIKSAFDLYYRSLAATLPHEEEIHETSFSPKFEKNMRLLFKRSSPAPSYRKTIFLRIATFFLICGLSVGILLTSQKIYTILNRQTNRSDIGALGSHDSQISDSDFVDFSYKPANYKLNTRKKEGNQIIATYSNHSGETFTFTQYKKETCPQNHLHFEKEFLIAKKYKGFTTNTNDICSLHIDAGDIHFIISSPTLPEKELFKIGNSISFPD